MKKPQTTFDSAFATLTIMNTPHNTNELKPVPDCAEPEAVYDTEIEVDDGIDNDSELSEAWKIEIKRRVDEYRSGRAILHDWKLVKEEGRKLLRK